MLRVPRRATKPTVLQSYQAHGKPRNPQRATRLTAARSTATRSTRLRRPDQRSHNGQIHGDQIHEAKVAGSTRSDPSTRLDPQGHDHRNQKVRPIHKARPTATRFRVDQPTAARSAANRSTAAESMRLRPPDPQGTTRPTAAGSTVTISELRDPRLPDPRRLDLRGYSGQINKDIVAGSTRPDPSTRSDPRRTDP